MAFNLDDYEPVEERIKKFYIDNPKGRIVTDLHFDDGDRVVFKASIYRNKEDAEPWATGWAQEVRDTELKKNKYGKEFESVNYASHLENCETSAIGRALANANYLGSKGRPSREEMDKVNRYQSRTKTEQTASHAATGTVHTPTDKQLTTIRGYMVQLGTEKDYRDEIVAKVKTFQQASDLIVQLKEKVANKRQVDAVKETMEQS